MKMFGAFDVRREAAAYLLRGKLSVDIGKHVDAALALRVDRNPGERGLRTFDGFNAREIQPVLGERLCYQTSALVVADESEPAGARAEPRDLREIVAGDAASVNLRAIDIDLLVRGKESRNNREIVDPTASDSHDLRGHVPPWMPVLIVAGVRVCQEKSGFRGANSSSNTAKRPRHERSETASMSRATGKGTGAATETAASWLEQLEPPPFWFSERLLVASPRRADPRSPCKISVPPAPL